MKWRSFLTLVCLVLLAFSCLSFGGVCQVVGPPPISGTTNPSMMSTPGPVGPVATHQPGGNIGFGTAQPFAFLPSGFLQFPGWPAMLMQTAPSFDRLQVMLEYAAGMSSVPPTIIPTNMVAAGVHPVASGRTSFVYLSFWVPGTAPFTPLLVTPFGFYAGVPPSVEIQIPFYAWQCFFPLNSSCFIPYNWVAAVSIDFPPGYLSFLVGQTIEVQATNFIPDAMGVFGLYAGPPITVTF